ncbi:MAG: ASKHA domain-containing protein [Desulfobacterales bacterium]|nr:ASKHA domain-containing protein [Desulfobacterales bacterium]
MKVLITLLFKGEKISIRARAGQVLATIIQEAGLDLELPCGGHRDCGACRVQVQGMLSLPTAVELELLGLEKIGQGERLACKSRIRGPAEIIVPETLQASGILVSGTERQTDLNPNISKKLLPPVIPAGSSLLESVKKSLAETGQPVALELEVADLEKDGARGVLTAVSRNGRVDLVEPGDTRAECFGLAVDVGTTTLVVALVDLISGREIDTVSALNPQVTYGHDVLTRITQVKGGQVSLHHLQEILVRELDRLGRALCQRHSISPARIYEAAVAGNTCMMHLLLGLDPVVLALAPYTSRIKGSIYIRATELGFKSLGRAHLYILPPISPFVGGDITAGILATDLAGGPKPTLFIDIGTNGEVVLVTENKTFACSVAAGPAFEGMNIACGMRAQPGAIESVRIENDGPRLKVIGQGRPQGICGSGLIDVVAQLREKELINPRGRIAADCAAPSLRPYLRDRNGKRSFLLFRDRGRQVYISQQDIRQVQLAKGACRAGINLLLKEAAIGPEAVKRVWVAGAFGYHLKPASLTRIGLLPREWHDRIVFVGNTAKVGAMLVLLNRRLRDEAAGLGRSVLTVDLVSHPEFDRQFIQAMLF